MRDAPEPLALLSLFYTKVDSPIELPPLNIFGLPHNSHPSFPLPFFFHSFQREGKKEERTVTRQKSDLQLLVRTWTSGFVKGLRRGFASSVRAKWPTPASC